MIRFRTPAVLLPLLLTMAVALAACGGNGPEGSVANARLTAGDSPEAGPLVPDFTVSTGGGTSFSPSGHRGEIILLYFSFPG